MQKTAAGRDAVPARFTIRARPDPQTLARILGLLAQRGLVPVTVCAKLDEDVLTMLIEQNDLDDMQAGIVAEKMRSSVLVESVALSRGRDHLIPSPGQRS